MRCKFYINFWLIYCNIDESSHGMETGVGVNRLLGAVQTGATNVLVLTKGSVL